MNDVFVVCNQLGQYWGKRKKWVDGTNPRRVLVCTHEDEAVNQLVELSARDIHLRGKVRAAETNQRGIPRIEPSEHLLVDEPDPPEEMTVEAAGDDTETAASNSDL